MLTRGLFAPQRRFPQPAPGAGCQAPGESLSADRVVSVPFGLAVGPNGVGRWQQLVTMWLWEHPSNPAESLLFFQGHKQQ